MRRHTSAYVSLFSLYQQLLRMCSHTPIYVSSYSYIEVLMRKKKKPETTRSVLNGIAAAVYVFSYSHILHINPRQRVECSTAARSYYYICALIFRDRNPQEKKKNLRQRVACSTAARSSRTALRSISSCATYTHRVCGHTYRSMRCEDTPTAV
jgi:hypothetical protein